MIFEVSIVPLDKGESVGKYVAKVIKIIHKSNLPYKLTAMSTQIEGEWDEVLFLFMRRYLREEWENFRTINWMQYVENPDSIIQNVYDLTNT